MFKGLRKPSGQLSKLVDFEAHHALARAAATEGAVLLKNENGFLPLDRKSLKSIAVIGPLADAVHWDWYGGTPPYAATPLQAIRRAVDPTSRLLLFWSRMAPRQWPPREKRMSRW